jgi:hypothetical protein
MENGGTAPRILKLGAGWMREVSFMPNNLPPGIGGWVVPRAGMQAVVSVDNRTSISLSFNP